MILLLLLCCLCVCGVDLTKNACGARPPSPLPCDGGGPPRKGGLFLLNVIDVDLVSFAELLGISAWFPILSEVVPEQLFMALREDASFLF